MKNESLKPILDKTGLKINDSGGIFSVSHKFDFWKQDTTGMLILGLGGIFMVAIGIVKSGDVLGAVLFIVIGALMVGLFAFAVLRQSLDFMEISNNAIIYRHLLQKRHESPVEKIKMSNRNMKVSRRFRTTTFIIVELHVESNGNERIVLQFQANNNDRTEAIALGRSIAKMANDKISELQ